MLGEGSHKWEFLPRFRRRAFGWRSDRPIRRIKEAVLEIRKVARRDPVLGAEGAVALIVRLSPALEQVDSSSGAIGTAVNRAIEALVPLVARAPVDTKRRAAWLERLFQAHADDDIPYIETLTDFWGELCASRELASEWADRLLGLTRMVLLPDKAPGARFHGTSACLSALFAAGRYEDLHDLLKTSRRWYFKCWEVKALHAQGKHDEALRMAEESRSPWASDVDIDRTCEGILLSCGRTEEAYAGYALRANRCGTYLATFRAVAAKYPHKSAREILADLVRTTPGDESKWFAAAKDAGLFEEALALAARTPCDPRTLTRAARDHVRDRPAFALGAGLLALRWLTYGYGYEICGPDVLEAYEVTMRAAEARGRTEEVKEEIRRMVAEGPPGGGYVGRFLSQKLMTKGTPVVG